MPSIWNTSNTYNVNSNNNKRLSSKLTFEVGERFTGKIINKGEGNEVTIRLSDGWQFNAELEGSLDGLENGNVKLQVEGHENGKLKLKLISDGSVDDKESSLENIILKEGLKKKDQVLLKAMVKFNIPLTKENINKIRSLVQFAEKINTNSEEVDKFIKSYLNSKEINPSSEKGQLVSNILKEFLSEYKTLSKEDILFFVENNIEFSKDGIDEYNRIFKNGNESLDNFFNNIKNTMNEVLGEEGVILKDELSGDLKKLDSVIEKNIQPNDIDKDDNNISDNKDFKENKVEKNISGKINTYENKEKVSILSVLKEIIKDSNHTINNETKESLNKFLTQNNIIDEEVVLNKDGLAEIKKELDSSGQTEHEITNNTKEETKLSQGIKKEVESNIKVKDEIGSNTKEEVKLDASIKKETITKEEIVLKEIVDSDNELAKKIIKSTISEKNNGFDLSSKELIKQDIKNNIDSIKEIVKEMINNSKLGGEAGEKIFNIIKNNMTSFKLLNSINNEYYYLDVPIKREDKEYPCKLIIKDDRKDGKKIDRNNVKMVVSVKTLNMGTVDGFLIFKDKKLQVDLKCDKSILKIIKKEKEKLEQNLNNLGFKVNIDVLERKEDVSITGCREFFSGNHKGLIDKKV